MTPFLAAALAGKMLSVQAEIWFDYKRGTVTIRETSSGMFVLSWYPGVPDDPTWPGFIVASDEFQDFPLHAAQRSHRAEIEGWLESQAGQPWNQPL